MTFLGDSSDCFPFSSLTLLEIIAEVEEESVGVVFSMCSCTSRSLGFARPPRPPRAVATIQALLVDLVFYLVCNAEQLVGNSFDVGIL